MCVTFFWMRKGREGWERAEGREWEWAPFPHVEVRGQLSGAHFLLPLCALGMGLGPLGLPLPNKHFTG